MREVFILFIFITVVTELNCNPSVCEYKEEDNVCKGDEDCLIAYCGVDCCACPVILSKKQFNSTYCMAESYSEARGLCKEAREKRCEDVDCSSQICPHPKGTKCENNKCIPIFQ